MTTEEQLGADVEATPRSGGLMGIWAHPDDEAFGTAGSLARAVRAGHHVAIVCATRGEQGKIADDALATPETLGRVREGELRAACAAVGVSDVSFLEYVDGHLAEADPDEAIGRIVRHIRRARPAVVTTFDPKGMYGHRDHVAIHRFALAAIEAAADPARYPEQARDGLAPHRVTKVYFAATPRERLIGMRDQMRDQGQDFIPGGDEATIPVEEMGYPRDEITTKVTLDDAEWEAKQRALRAHATQMPSDSPWANASPDELRAFLGAETFVVAPPPISARAFTTPEDDLFAGL